jgi:FKBP-type peptidyl-prolyl cis-trans isomerase FklB
MKKIVFCLLAISLQQLSIAQVKKSPTPKSKTAGSDVVLKSAIDSFSYAAGLSIAGSMQQQGIDNINSEILSKALDDVLKKKPQLLTQEQATMTLQQKLQEFAKKKNDAQKEKGAACIAENKKRKGVISLPNGLLYEVLKSGEAGGIKPTSIDTVVVDYVGTLVDGTEFDNSIKRGEPAEFPVNGVIKGWTEILQLMTKGDKWKVYIPSELGYGERGAGGSIPPNSTLIFEINLIDIKPAIKP